MNKKYFNTNIQKTKIIHKNSLDKKRDDNLISTSLHLMLLISTVALRYEFDFGTQRIQRFHDKVNELLEGYNEGYVSMDDYNKMIFEETGIRIIDLDNIDGERYKYKE